MLSGRGGGGGGEGRGGVRGWEGFQRSDGKAGPQLGWCTLHLEHAVKEIAVATPAVAKLAYHVQRHSRVNADDIQQNSADDIQKTSADDIQEGSGGVHCASKVLRTKQDCRNRGKMVSTKLPSGFI